jgi:hypothetical protein
MIWLQKKKLFNAKDTIKTLFNSRHYNLSIIFTMQAYNSICKSIRLNTSVLVLFNSANKKELELIYNENVSNLNFKEFYKLYRECMDARPFNFLVINYQNPKPENRFEENFERFIT